MNSIIATFTAVSIFHNDNEEIICIDILFHYYYKISQFIYESQYININISLDLFETIIYALVMSKIICYIS